MKTGTVLMYNCAGTEFSKLRQIFAMLRLRMRQVGPERYHVSLEQLADGKGEAMEQEGQAIQENMLVFCNVSQALLTQVLEVIRLAKLPPIQLKAVMTQANQDWDTRQLHQELLEEQQSIAKQQQGEKAEEP